MGEIEPQSRFWVEAQVAVAKSAVFLAAAEADVSRHDFSLGAVDAYYGLFHLSLALMWLLPESLPVKLRESLASTRDAGSVLPNKLTSHKAAERFLCDGQVDLPVPKLGTLFREALELREFASYGHRVSYDAPGEPVVGPCSLTPNRVERVVRTAPPVFTEALRAAWPRTAYDGALGQITADGARRLLDDPQFPFKDWHSPAALGRARQLLGTLLGASSR